MSLVTAEIIRRDIKALFGSLGVTKFYAITPDEPYGDPMGKDPAATPGATVLFSGAVASLETEARGSMTEIAVPGDFRATMNIEPDQEAWITEVLPDGSPKAGAIPARIVGTPDASAELAMTDGIGLTAVHIQQGAP